MNKTVVKQSAVVVALVVVGFLCSGAVFGKKEKSTADLVSIASVGGGLSIDATSRSQAELVSIAGIFGNRHQTLYLKNCGEIATADLVAITSVGGGNVVLEF